jgi:hypothetical protein
MRRLLNLVCVGACAILAGCSTPYKPPVTVKGSSSFDGLLELARQQQGLQPLDVVMAHGMCTHDPEWAAQSINSMMEVLSSQQPRLDKNTEAPQIPGTEIQMIRSQVTGEGATFRISALVWSPLTAKLKQQLLYDRTGDPSTDCATDKECKPKRVRLNALIKDKLVSDCFADALIYQGGSKDEILRQMKIALAYATAPEIDISSASFKALDVQSATLRADKASASAEGSLAVITDSLGSKVLFDALDAQATKNSTPAARAAADRTRERIGLVFMRANQLPLLALADAERQGSDPIKSLANEKTQVRGATGFQRTVVAFSDPNDLLSYPLLGSSYQGPSWASVKLADILVSNKTSWLGLLENPWGAHTGYGENRDVTRLMLHGSDKTARKP